MSVFGNKSKKDRTVNKETEEKSDGLASRKTSLPKGGDAHSYQVILSPHITEKASLMNQDNKYVFKVSGASGKIEIKKSIEKMYKVKVKSVRVLNMPSKFRQVGKFEGTKSGFRKAIITLRDGYRIDLAV